MSKRLAFISGSILFLLFAAATDSSAQARRGHGRHVVVVNSFAYANPFWYYDPWFDDYQWGGMYPVYGGYRRYALADSSVKLEVKPNKAEVFVDGYYAGIVDDFDGAFQRLHVAPGQHEIELYLDGYRTVRQKVYLTPDNTFKMKYEMEKLQPGDQPEPRPEPLPPPQGAGPGSPYPQPYPPAPRGPSTRRAPQPPNPPPGAPRDPRDVRPGDARTGDVGTLAVRIQPGDAEVRVDGEPWRGPDGQDRLLIDLPEGRHTVEIRKPGFRTYVTDVDVRRGETTPLNVTLRSQDEDKR